MSAFSPTETRLEPDRPDQLAGAVMQSLCRAVPVRASWGAVKTALLAGFSFGILPLLIWPRRLAKFILIERQQMWHLAEFLRVRGATDAQSLANSVQNAEPPATVKFIPFVLVMILVAAFLRLGVLFMGVNAVYSVTYGVHSMYFVHSLPIGLRQSPQLMFKVWTITLSLAYFSHWMHIKAHESDMRRFAQRVNAIYAKQQIPPARWPGPGWAGEPFWIAAAVIGVSYGAWWAIPAALAGMAQQRYVRHTSGRIRAELARGVRMMLVEQRPAVDVPTPWKLRSKCSNHLCLSALPAGAAFCPRCGTRAGTSLNAVA